MGDRRAHSPEGSSGLGSDRDLPSGGVTIYQTFNNCQLNTVGHIENANFANVHHDGEFLLCPES
jgi:hypothetical protein